MSKPYAFINDRPIHYATLRANTSTNYIAQDKFDLLNRHLAHAWVMPGQVVLVGDDFTRQRTNEEAELMCYALQAYSALVGTTEEERRVIIQNYDLLQKLLNYSSIGIGSTSAAWEKHLKEVKSTLDEIQGLHKQYLRDKSGPRKEFVARRRVLFDKLDQQLKGFARFGTGLRNNGSIKHMLGISTKSYIHTGDIRGYAQRLQDISKAAGYMTKGGYVGIALSAGSSALEIKEACSAGRESECTKAKYVETSKFIGGVSFAAAGGGGAGMVAATTLCLALTIPSGGTSLLACSIIGSAAGGVAGEKIGSYFFEKIGHILYELIGA